MRPRVVQITALAVLPEAEILARVSRAAASGEAARFAVQLRDPELTSRALWSLGARLRDATRAAGARLVVNDRIDLAIGLGADGVHLGRRSVQVARARALVPGAWISVACHSVDDVVRAATEGADAVLLSPIFASPGKGDPIGAGALADAREALDARGFARVSLIALGGVDAASAHACFAAGADGVAAIRADLIDLLGRGGA